MELAGRDAPENPPLARGARLAEKDPNAALGIPAAMPAPLGVPEEPAGPPLEPPSPPLEPLGPTPGPRPALAAGGGEVATEGMGWARVLFASARPDGPACREPGGSSRASIAW